MKITLRIIVLLIAFLCPLRLGAQFYMSGNERASIKWKSLGTDNYDVIFPEGTDSLARVFAEKLEKYRKSVGKSIGFAPFGGFFRKTPVILHAYNVNSNGMVVWAPRRLELYGTPTAYDPDPMPWEDLLAIHEQRHIAQMNLPYRNTMKPVNYLAGEMFSGFCAGLYFGNMFLEGDAVLAETALSNSGRGRQARFLNYFRIAFDKGEFRNSPRWLSGNLLEYAPDKYAFSYLLLSGARYFYGKPDFCALWADYASRHPLDINIRSTIFRRTIGLDHVGAFDSLAREYSGFWKEDIASRAPFTPSEAVTGPKRTYTVYDKLAPYGSSGVLAVRNSLTRCRELVAIGPDKKEKRLGAFASQASELEPVGDRVYWSESVKDPRWDMEVSSHIRYLDISDGRKHTLDKSGRYFNPASSPDSKTLSLTEYPVRGGSCISLMDIGTSCVTIQLHAPDSLQIVRTAWIGDTIFATGVSDGGFGIYRVSPDDGLFTTVLAPEPVSITGFRSRGDLLYFICDRDSFEELYSLNPESGELLLLTKSRYGISSYAISGDGGDLWLSLHEYEGDLPGRSGISDLTPAKVSFHDIHKYRIADCLSEQDSQMGAEPSLEPVCPEASRYRHQIVNVHSWAPVYFDKDAILDRSFDYIYEAASPGATVMSQNVLSSLYVTAGYSWHRDPSGNGPRRHSGHVKLLYSGLYPVFEASVHFNDRNARQYNTVCSQYGARFHTTELDKPFLSASLDAYIPLSWNRGGWNSGFIPKLSLDFSNDVYKQGYAYEYRYPVLRGEPGDIAEMAGWEGEGFRYSSSGTASLRGYLMRPVATSGVYPRWGIGAEVGFCGNYASRGAISPQAFAYLYGYVPGIMESHGIKLTGIAQKPLSNSSFLNGTTVRTIPRGFRDISSTGMFVNSHGCSGMVTLDYAFPFGFRNFNIGRGLLYVSRFDAGLNFDCCFFRTGTLNSIGFSLSATTGSILRFFFNAKFGFRVNRNGGSAFQLVPGANRWLITPVFGFDL